MKSLKVVIGIPTYKRPLGLKKLLDSIALQDVDFMLTIVVADNEGDQGQGLKVVEETINSGYPFDLHAIPVNDRGISQVRNALIEYGFHQLHADNLAMIDDDEWVEKQWISELVKVQIQTGADVVGGSVAPEFEGGRPEWAQNLNIYYQTDSNESGPVELVQGTTNVLLNRGVVTKYPSERFDEFYSLVGGGDKEFFTRLKRRGATFAFSHLAQAHELFGASRMTKEWAIERAYRIGAGDMRIIMKNRPGLSTTVGELAKLLGAIFTSGLLLVVLRPFSSKYMAARLKLARQIGKISAIGGRQKEVYSKVHGG